MLKDKNFLQDIQRYIAITTIGPSTLRNQGSKGVIKAAQKYLAKIDLNIFQTNIEVDFLKTLDRETEKLKTAFPMESQHWGAARKALNIFLRDIFYNRFLSCKVKFNEEWMEIPLDRLVATALKRIGKRGQLPPWPGLNQLNPETNHIFQVFAKDVASKEGITRAHLDVILWAKEREINGE